MDLKEQLLHENILDYSRRDDFSKNELTVDQYLNRLPPIDKINITLLLYDLRKTFFYWEDAHVLAVGSTTFDGKYWEGLHTYLKKNDPSKLDYVRRGGEDIDLVITNSFRGHLLPEVTEFIKKDLEGSKRNYIYEPFQRDSGNFYHRNPEENRTGIEKVLRHKDIAYGESFDIKMDKGRDIHLVLDAGTGGEEKLRYERVNNLNFSLIVVHSHYMNFLREVYHSASQLELGLKPVEDYLDEYKKLEEIIKGNDKLKDKMEKNRKNPPKIPDDEIPF